MFAPVSGLSFYWFDITSIMSVIGPSDSPDILSEITVLMLCANMENIH